MRILEPILKKIDNNIKHKKILVYCVTGVNKTSAVVIAYAIKYLGYKFNDIVKKIDEIKIKKYKRFWATLTSLQFKKYLSCMIPPCKSPNVYMVLKMAIDFIIMYKRSEI